MIDWKRTGLISVVMGMALASTVVWADDTARPLIAEQLGLDGVFEDEVTTAHHCSSLNGDWIVLRVMGIEGLSDAEIEAKYGITAQEFRRKIDLADKFGAKAGGFIAGAKALQGRTDMWTLDQVGAYAGRMSELREADVKAFVRAPDVDRCAEYYKIEAS